MPGDQTQRFAELFVRYQRRVYGFMVSMVPHTADADELFQEASLILWKKIDEFDAPAGADAGEAFVRWANAVAMNVIRNWRVKRSRDRHTFSDELMRSIAERQAERGADLDERLGALARCMDALGEGDRGLLGEFYAERRSAPEIAEARRQSTNALYQRLHRIRRALLGCIDRKMTEARTP